MAYASIKKTSVNDGNEIIFQGVYGELVQLATETNQKAVLSFDGTPTGTATIVPWIKDAVGQTLAPITLPLTVLIDGRIGVRQVNSVSVAGEELKLYVIY